MCIGGNIPPKYDDASVPTKIIRCIDTPAVGQPGCWHEDIEIKLIHTETTVAVIDSEIFTAKEDEILFVNPYQIHSLPTIGESCRPVYSLFMMHLDFFQISGIQSLNLRKIFMEDRVQVRNHIKNPRLTGILKNILSVDSSSSVFKKQRIQGLFMEFFSILLEEEKTECTGSVSSDRVRYYYMIEPALKIIHSQYNQKIESEELAQCCHISLCYFCRIFRRVLGMTPTQYQTEYRMRIADMLLKNKEHTVAEIAHMVGYEDEAYFSRCFKKHKGIAPRQRQ